jgi:regulator of CtrA degradation
VTQGDAVEDTSNVAFFGRTYQEALNLTREARDYIAGNLGKDRGSESADVRLASSCEEMRLTARMTQIMAWLLLQRAIHEGEVPRSEALKAENRLSGQETCLGDPPIADVELPPRLNDLMARSRALYERIQRLDAMLDA